MGNINRYFKTLELEPGASAEEVKHAYRDLVKVWHPDRFPNDPRLQQKAAEKLKEINEAYERLQSSPPSPRPRTPQSESRSQRPGPRRGRGASCSRQPQAATGQKAHQGWQPFPAASVADRSIGPGGWILLALTAAMVWALGVFEGTPREIPDSLLSPSGAIQLANPGYFTVGSTKDEVLSVQGTPIRIILASNTSIWYYGLSKVTFAQGHVVSWDISPKDPLKVKTVPPGSRQDE